jgi:epoxyqueuosine reductase
MNLLTGRAPNELVKAAFGRAGIDRGGIIDFETDFANARIIRDLSESAAFIEEKRHGGMRFLESQLAARRDAQQLLAGARSAVMVVVPYNGQSCAHPNILAYVSRYAHVRDYHRSIKSALEKASQNLAAGLGQPFDCRGVVDSAPLLERSFAREAGMGFVGKHTCLVVPGVGSFVFIAALITTLAASELASENSVNSNLTEVDCGPSFCGECVRCVRACPTGAIISDYKIDARRCLSYLSIEHRGLVDDVYVPAFSHGIFGCDLCQEACPYNRAVKSRPIVSPLLLPFVAPEVSVEKIATMSQQEYELWFGGTSLTRAKCNGLIRNALYNLFATKSPKIESVLSFWNEKDNEFIKTVVDQIRRLLVGQAGNDGNF